MTQTDTIGDFITRIRNASSAKKDTLECPSSNMRKSLCEILKREGFIRDFRLIKDNKQGILRVYLKYAKDSEKAPAITDLQRVSTPGLRIYKQSDEIKPVLGERGMAVVSTSKGILTDKECREYKIGGEILFQVW